MTISDLKSPPPPPITGRSLHKLEVDTAALYAIAQAAVDVELFTIPLYMTSMYSLYGTHQINSKGINYYEGREWPGLAPVAKPTSVNEEVFNTIFSVFIQEMLHLQMAANLANAIAVPGLTFTGAALQGENGSWHCYGPHQTLIPHIVDLQHIEKYRHVRVNLEALNANQCDLFLAIEQPEETARALINQADVDYTVQVPLRGWEKGDALPLFGTIGMMYECYVQYISIEYEDGETLWKKLYRQNSLQRDIFNGRGTGTNPHLPPTKAPEFPKLNTCFDATQDADTAFNSAIDMMTAITDQGEGNASRIRRYQRIRLLQAVEQDFRESLEALKLDYPSYMNDGSKAQDSAHAYARSDNAAYDHYERFGDVKKNLANVKTWSDWHANGGTWTQELLTNASYKPATAVKIPPPQAVADALNRLKDSADIHTTLSTIAAGSLYGVTSVLTSYWQAPKVEFPMPSMVGSGDRISFCWAVLGKAPDLMQTAPGQPTPMIDHACQGLSLKPGADNSCGSQSNYHTCRGSNLCATLGGCGFVQDYTKTGGGCGRPMPPDPSGELRYSAPADNRCKSAGGCAVPMSASQLFPSVGQMRLFKFPEHGPVAQFPPEDDLSFTVGDNVYDHAWDVYVKVMRDRTGGQQPDPVKPKTSDLRLALPPST